jgi:CheY-specific phosphatase CheX
MNNSNGAVREVIESLFEKATLEVFGPLNLTLNSVVHDASICNKQLVGDSVLSVLNASGDGVKILCSINANFSTLEALFPHGAHARSEELRDWCGELNNQLVGAAKNYLLAYKCKVLMGLPALIQGENLASISSSQACISKRSYLSDKGEIVAYLSTVIDPNFEMADEPDESLTGLTQGGELSFF